MTLENGTVLDVREGRALLLLEPEDARECAECGLCNRAKPGHIWVCAQHFPSLKIGDVVTVERRLPSPYVAILLGLLLPTIAFIGGAWFGLRLAQSVPALAAHAMLISFGVSVVCMLLVYVAAAIYDRNYRRRTGELIRLIDFVTTTRE